MANTTFFTQEERTILSQRGKDAWNNLSEEEKQAKSVILVSRSGQTVRLPLADIRITGRNTQGVILAKLKDTDDTFTSATLAEEE